MTDTTEIVPVVSTGRFAGLREFWHYFSQSRGAVLGLVVFILLILVALFAPWIAPHDPTEQYKQFFLAPPAWDPGGNPQFLLGTDPVGRDILSRLIHGARFSLLIGAMVVVLSVVGGIVLGLVAGYFRGWVDVVIMRVMDLILAFPPLLLALVLVTVLGPGLVNAMLAIALTLQPYFARLVRGSVMAERNREYVTSARLAGAGHFRLMLVTILPNCLAPIIVQATLSFSDAILNAAALGFLGLGAQPPTPEWGTMLANAREFIQRAPWVVTFPGLCILVTVLAINLIGDGLRDALDPKLKRS
ncbi:MAG: dipeptide ABC transporter permease DppC [Devosia sp. 67-54]|uniref:ABC transporter permease subunit n=1 Tax=unclassified Devosia TaxID=196773 RepID=UPI000966B9B5|nr:MULTISPECIES: ABC transporter permease subunit [unclassified Devosia]MBN9304569.1 ABC transporter permease subunit [Devosia sp.]OJX15437.1 MAG: dipeptide ABC transporter permease DppC [Devosia sp. 67-54]